MLSRRSKGEDASGTVDARKSIRFASIHDCSTSPRIAFRRRPPCVSTATVVQPPRPYTKGTGERLALRTQQRWQNETGLPSRHVSPMQRVSDPELLTEGKTIRRENSKVSRLYYRRRVDRARQSITQASWKAVPNVTFEGSHVDRI